METNIRKHLSVETIDGLMDVYAKWAGYKDFQHALKTTTKNSHSLYIDAIRYTLKGIVSANIVRFGEADESDFINHDKVSTWLDSYAFSEGFHDFNYLTTFTQSLNAIHKTYLDSVYYMLEYLQDDEIITITPTSTKIGKRELLSEECKDILMEIGHIINKTEFKIKRDTASGKRIYVDSDVYALNEGKRFITYETSPSLSPSQVMDIGTILKGMNYDPTLSLY